MVIKCQGGYRAVEEALPQGDEVAEWVNTRALSICSASIKCPSFIQIEMLSEMVVHIVFKKKIL